MDDYGVDASGSQTGDQESHVSSDQGGHESSGSHITHRQWIAKASPNQSSNTSISAPIITPSQTNSPTPSSTSSPSSGLSSSGRTAIIASVLGGVGGLLILSLIAIYFLQKRKAKKSTNLKSVTQQVSYNGLNSSFAGVPFIKRNSHPIDGEISPPPIVADTSYQGAYFKGGQPSCPDLSSDRETDQFLPSHQETQPRTPAGANGFLSPSDNSISPVSTRDPFTDQNRLSQMSQSTMSPTRPGLVRHDTMGFPLDDDCTSYIGLDGREHRLSRVIHSSRSSFHESNILSPSPIHPSVSQEDLELGVWRNPNHDLNQNQPQHLNSLTSNYDNPYEFSNENNTVSPLYESYPAERSLSPISVQSGAWIAAHNPHLAAAGSFGNVRRNMSQRTQSSFAPSIVSDTELERLGVGQRMI